MKNKKGLFILLGFLVLFLISFIFIEPFNLMIRQMLATLSTANVDAAKGYILSFGVWAPVISFFLMILQSIAAPLPAFIITFANAALFGSLWGGILSWSSAMVGAIICFFIARFLGRNVVEKLTSKFSLNDIDSFFDKHGKYAILIARLLPFISFDLVSYAAGLTKMGFWSFFIATGIGQLPATIVYSIVGKQLVGGTKLMVTGLLLLFAFSTLIFMVKKIYKEKFN